MVIRICLTTFYLLAVTPSFGGPPDLKAWVKEFETMLKDRPKNIGLYPLKIAAITKLKKGKPPKLAKLKNKEFQKAQSMLKTSNSKALKLFLTLNQKPENAEKKPKIPPKKELIASLFSPLEASAIIDASSSTWALYHMDRGTITKTIKESGPGEVDAAGIIKWLAENIGYDGVILDTKGNYLLIGSVTALSLKGVTARIALDSHNAMVLKGKNRLDYELLMTKIGPGYHIFQYSGKKPDTLPQLKGLKIIIKK